MAEAGGRGFLLGPVTNEAAADGYGLGFMVLCRRQVPSDGSTA